MFSISPYSRYCHLMPYPLAESLPALLRSKVLMENASSPKSSRWQTPVHVLDLTDRTLSIIRGPHIRITTTGKAVVASSSGPGLNIKGKMSRPPRTPLPCNDCRTLGHRSTTTLTNKSRSTSIISIPSMCLGKYKMLALDGRQATL